MEETGTGVVVGSLAGVYSNTKSHIVMFDFLCEPVSGELRTSPESLAVERLEFTGEVVYRAYEFNADEVDTPDTVHQERHF